MSPPTKQLARDEANPAVVFQPLEQCGRGLLLIVEFRAERVDVVATQRAVAENLDVGKLPVHQC